MLGLAMGVTRLAQTRNEYIRGTAKVAGMGVKLRELVGVIWTCDTKK